MSIERIKVKVSRCWAEALDVRALDLQHEDGSALPPWQPGDHIDIELPSGEVRQYSLYNHPQDTNVYRVAVKKEPVSRGGSIYLHDQVAEGDFLRISLPRSNFLLVPEISRHVLVAGGIGITPLLAMAQQLAAGGADFELHYFVRSEQHAAFAELLRRADLAGRVSLYLGADAAETEAILSRILEGQPRGTHLYYCGPTPFMQAVLRCATARQWPPEMLHWEYFSPPDEDTPAKDGGNKPFTLRLASTNREFVIPADKTALQVLTENGVQVANSCQQGTCGSCVVKVVEGVPDNRDHFLSEFQKNAGKKVALCISRAKTDVLAVEL